MSIISEICISEAFIDLLVEKIQDKIENSSVDVYDTEQGQSNGMVGTYDLDRNFSFDWTGSSLDWAVSFRTTAEATIQYVTPDGESRAKQIEGDCEGIIYIL